MDHATLTLADVTLRLALALGCGAIIGLNRDLHHKGAGLRTFGLVALGTAGLTVGSLLAFTAPDDNVSRVILLALALALLVFGRRVERAVERIFGQPREESPPTADATDK